MVIYVTGFLRELEIFVCGGYICNDGSVGIFGCGKSRVWYQIIVVGTNFNKSLRVIKVIW